MKQSSKYVIRALVYAATIGFIAGVIFDIAGLKNVGLLVSWLLVVAGSFAGSLALIISWVADCADDGPAKDKAILFCKNVTETRKKREPIARFFSWVNSITLIVCAAYAGYIVTAIFYGLTVALVSLAVFAAADAAKTHGDKVTSKTE